MKKKIFPFFFPLMEKDKDIFLPVKLQDYNSLAKIRVFPLCSVHIAESFRKDRTLLPLFLCSQESKPGNLSPRILD